MFEEKVGERLKLLHRGVFLGKNGETRRQQFPAISRVVGGNAEEMRRGAADDKLEHLGQFRISGQRHLQPALLGENVVPPRLSE